MHMNAECKFLVSLHLSFPHLVVSSHMPLLHNPFLSYTLLQRIQRLHGPYKLQHSSLYFSIPRGQKKMDGLSIANVEAKCQVSGWGVE